MTDAKQVAKRFKISRELTIVFGVLALFITFVVLMVVFNQQISNFLYNLAGKPREQVTDPQVASEATLC